MGDDVEDEVEVVLDEDLTQGHEEEETIEEEQKVVVVTEPPIEDNGSDEEDEGEGNDGQGEDNHQGGADGAGKDDDGVAGPAPKPKIAEVREEEEEAEDMGDAEEEGELVSDECVPSGKVLFELTKNHVYGLVGALVGVALMVSLFIYVIVVSCVDHCLALNCLRRTIEEIARCEDIRLFGVFDLQILITRDLLQMVEGRMGLGEIRKGKLLWRLFKKSFCSCRARERRLEAECIRNRLDLYARGDEVRRFLPHPPIYNGGLNGIGGAGPPAGARGLPIPNQMPPRPIGPASAPVPGGPHVDAICRIDGVAGAVVYEAVAAQEALGQRRDVAGPEEVVDEIEFDDGVYENPENGDVEGGGPSA